MCTTVTIDELPLEPPVFEGGTGMAAGIDPTSNVSIHEASGEDLDILGHAQ